jgi:hypothetical protein
MRKVLSCLFVPALLFAALLTAPTAARAAGGPYYPGDGGRETVASSREKALQDVAYVAAAVLGVALVGGIWKLRHDTKSASANAHRPRKPWEQLP